MKILGHKRICDLVPGEIFLDTLGAFLEVRKITPLPWAGITGTSRKVMVYMKTQTGNEMHMAYTADRLVEVANEH